MGTLQAIEFANSGVDIDTVLHWHLKANHFPPIHESFIPVAKQAIDVGVEACETEDWELLDEVVTMPNGKELCLGEIVVGLHLQPFIDARLEDEEGSSWD